MGHVRALLAASGSPGGACTPLPVGAAAADLSPLPHRERCLPEGHALATVQEATPSQCGARARRTYCRRLGLEARYTGTFTIVRPSSAVIVQSGAAETSTPTRCRVKTR